MDITSFENAFTTDIGTYRGVCKCGKTFYNPHDSWDWTQGELESLEENAETVPTISSIRFFAFEGSVYVEQCDCWKERANMIMGFLDGHMSQIAGYFKEERNRKLAEADAIPDINVA